MPVLPAGRHHSSDGDLVALPAAELVTLNRRRRAASAVLEMRLPGHASGARNWWLSKSGCLHCPLAEGEAAIAIERSTVFSERAAIERQGRASQDFWRSAS